MISVSVVRNSHLTSWGLQRASEFYSSFGGPEIYFFLTRWWCHVKLTSLHQCFSIQPKLDIVAKLLCWQFRCWFWWSEAEPGTNCQHIRGRPSAVSFCKGASLSDHVALWYHISVIIQIFSASHRSYFCIIATLVLCQSGHVLNVFLWLVICF